jgi:integrase
LTICMIQLRNGSRISEAIKSLYKFMKQNNGEIINVKISKSDALHFSKKKQEWKKSVARYRKIIFPNWIDKSIVEVIKEINIDYFNNIDDPINTIRKRINKYLYSNFKCNTHSLRYAYINYLLFKLNKPVNEVAKIVGHVDINQMVRYTQQCKAENSLTNHEDY